MPRVFNSEYKPDPTIQPGAVCFIDERGKARPLVSSGGQWLALGAVSVSAADVADLKAAGTPIVPGITIVDPEAPFDVLGTTDGDGDVVSGGPGGGASAFTELGDAPSSYIGNAGKVLVVSASENGLLFDQEENGDKLIEGGTGGNAVVRGGPESGNAHLEGGSNGGNARVKAGSLGGTAIMQNANSSKAIYVDDDAITVVGLPTSNPAQAGALWNDAGTLKISAG